MAEQILIDEGRKLIFKIQGEGTELAFAVWYTDPLAQRTFLALGAKKFDEDGPSRAYGKILSVFESLRNQFHFFKVDFLKLVSLESELGQTFLNSFSEKKGDTMIGMFVSSHFIFHQVYAYGL